MSIKKHTIENDFLKVEIIPELGGRISSLIYKKSKKDWVWKNPNLKVGKVPDAKNYDDNWQGGWEELFPNDAVENFSWGKGHDHGELWFNSWDLKYINLDSAKLEINNLDSGSKFSKLITIDGPKLICEYEGEINFIDYFLFKLHLAIPLEKTLSIKSNIQSINKVDPNFGNILNTEDNEKFLNPNINSGLFDFAYLDILGNEISVLDENRNQLKIKYDDKNLKYFWIFQSQGGWMNHNVIVLEPCTNGRKDITEAASQNMSIKGPKDFKTKYIVELDKL